MLLQVHCITVGSGVEKVLAAVIPPSQDRANVLERFRTDSKIHSAHSHIHARAFLLYLPQF